MEWKAPAGQANRPIYLSIECVRAPVGACGRVPACLPVCTIMSDYSKPERTFGVRLLDLAKETKQMLVPHLIWHWHSHTGRGSAHTRTLRHSTRAGVRRPGRME